MDEAKKPIEAFVLRARMASRRYFGTATKATIKGWVAHLRIDSNRGFCFTCKDGIEEIYGTATKATIKGWVAHLRIDSNRGF